MLRPAAHWMNTLASALLAASCATATNPSAPADRVALSVGPSSSTDFRIGPEDVIEISVWKNDAISRTVPVRPDGAISLPLINDIQASGLTPMELRALLTQKLLVFMPAPEVSVIVREVHSAKVSVLGEVIHPGTYELHGPTTVLEMLAHAGGLSAFASRSQIFVLRPRAGATERIAVDESQALSDAQHDNLPLLSGDLLFVP